MNLKTKERKAKMRRSHLFSLSRYLPLSRNTKNANDETTKLNQKNVSILSLSKKRHMEKVFMYAVVFKYSCAKESERQTDR